MASTAIETPPSTQPVGRPSFHHRCTEDRIREGTGRPPSFSGSGKFPRERKSVFKELGLDTTNIHSSEPTGSNPHTSSNYEYQTTTGNGNPKDHSNKRACDDNEYNDDYTAPPRRSKTTPAQPSGGRRTASASEPVSPTIPDSSSSPYHHHHHPRQQQQQQQQQQEQQQQRPWYSKLTQVRRPKIRTASSAPPPSLSTLTKLSSVALLLAVLQPFFGYFRG
ncbi:hypothetical protein B0J18DRAFT_37158 [Chaetomium sp. MPI-SDFR-AT-0129]|nr:hypothetical protein B0J18DRAFT_37158 [Chaetomium sp. MPI-SDFR-AT-0129]